MGKILLGLVVAIMSCAPAKQPARWPNHRQQHDEQLEQLKIRANQLEASEHLLYERIEKLEKELAGLKQAAPAQPPASAVPSPGT
jgi:phage shock protein A